MRSQVPPKQSTVLVIEDELRSQRLLRMNLEPLGYRVVTIPTASDATEVLETYSPDLIVLDLKLPGVDGFELCRQIRSQSTVPVIIVSGSSQSLDKVRGLELGADDYVTKPYDPAELAARVEAVLRRVRGIQITSVPIFRSGRLQIDFEQRLVRVAGEEVGLTGTEYRLLEYLAQNAGRTLIADTLLVKVWGPEYTGEYASLHLYISRLRRKLKESSQSPSLILTKPGVGYQMALIDESQSS